MSASIGDLLSWFFASLMFGFLGAFSFETAFVLAGVWVSQITFDVFFVLMFVSFAVLFYSERMRGVR